MSHSKDFGEGILSTVTNHIFFFLMMNIYFLLSVLPTIAFLLIIEPSLLNIIPVSLMGPGLVSLISCMIKLRERDVEKDDFPGFSDFVNAYKSNFTDSLKVFLPYVVLMFVLYTNVAYFAGNPALRLGVILVAVILMVVATLCVTYMLLITAKFKFKLTALLKISMYYILGRAKITFRIFIIYFVLVGGSFFVSFFLYLFCVSILVYVIMLYTKGILEDVSENFIA